MFGAPVTRAALLSRPVISPLTILSFDCAVWYDNQDLSTMFADYVGTPASVGTAVALQLDKSQGGAMGPEIRATGTINLAGTATAATYNTSTGVGTATRVDAANQSSVRFAITTGRPYFVDVENTGSDSVAVRDGNSSAALIASVAAGQRKTVFVPTTSIIISITAFTNGMTASFTVHSVKEVLGTPRYQTTAAQRPILGRHPKGGRRNRWLHSADLTNATNQVTGVTRTSATVVTEDTSTGGHRVLQVITLAAGTHTLAFDVKLTGRDWIYVYADSGLKTAYINLSTRTVGSTFGSSTVSFEDRADGAVRVRFTWTGVITTGQNVQVWFATASGTNSYTGNGTATMQLTDIQLETGSTATAYQNVTSTYDCTETGVPDVYYLQADGSDDGMVTPALDLSGTDKIGVFTAVRKLSDAAAGVLVELSTSILTNNGSFRFAIPDSAAANFNWASKGTAQSSASYTDASAASPKTAVLTGIADIAGPSVVQRLNGVQVASSSSNQGTGNYGNYPLYFFRRGGATVPFNGLEYGNVISIAPTLGQAAAMETYRNNIVGGY